MPERIREVVDGPEPTSAEEGDRPAIASRETRAHQTDVTSDGTHDEDEQERNADALPGDAGEDARNQSPTEE